MGSYRGYRFPKASPWACSLSPPLRGGWRDGKNRLTCVEMRREHRGGGGTRRACRAGSGQASAFESKDAQLAGRRGGVSTAR